MPCRCEEAKPGTMVPVVPGPFGVNCAKCGREVMRDDFYSAKLKRWDTYYRSICEAVASKSPCHSRKIGSLLVKENVIVATGFNGPARGYPHCQGNCPRKSIEGYESGKFLDKCPATHSEANCIVSAARTGVAVSGSTLYMNCVVPCKDCMNLLVNAGVKEIVIDELVPYHEVSIHIAEHAKVKLRRFNL